MDGNSLTLQQIKLAETTNTETFSKNQLKTNTALQFKDAGIQFKTI